ncbi:hypothetical protein PG988_010480 [Apiospora saccharicola]
MSRGISSSCKQATPSSTQGHWYLPDGSRIDSSVDDVVVESSLDETGEETLEDAGEETETEDIACGESGSKDCGVETISKEKLGEEPFEEIEMSELTDGVGLGVVLNGFEIAICVFVGEAIAAARNTEDGRVNVLVRFVAECSIGKKVKTRREDLVNAMGAIVSILESEGGLGTLAPPLGPVVYVHGGTAAAVARSEVYPRDS